MSIFTSGGDLKQLFPPVKVIANQLTIDFNNIPQGFTNLIFKGGARITLAGTGGATMYQQFNGNAVAGNYKSLATVMFNPNTLFTVEDLVSGYGVTCGANVNGDLANSFSSFTLDIPNYAINGIRKSWVSSCFLAGTGLANGLRVFYSGGTWLGTAPITRVTFSRGAAFYAPGTEITCYGIK